MRFDASTGFVREDLCVSFKSFTGVFEAFKSYLDKAGLDQQELGLM